MNRLFLLIAAVAAILAALASYAQIGGEAAPPPNLVVTELTALQPAEPTTQANGALKKTLQTPPLANTKRLRLSGEQTLTLEIAGNYSAASFGGFCIELLRGTLENWSNGKIQMIHYSDSLLGSDREIFSAVRAGSVPMGFMTSAPQIVYVPEVAVFDMGGYPTDYEAAAKTMRSGAFRDAVNAAYAKAGVELVALFPTSFRELGTTSPVRSFDDLKDLRIRVMENANHAEFWRLVGADPVQMPMLDTYISLQQGLLNASENPLDTMLTNKITEQSKFYTETRHILFNNTIFCNQQIWNNLPDDYKAMIAYALQRVSDWAAVNGPLRTKTAIKEMEEAGCEILLFSTRDHERMRKAAQPLYEKIRRNIGNEIVDLWLSELKKNAVCPD